MAFVGAAYSFDGLGRLSGLDWNLAGTGDDFGYDFSFNPGSQIVSSTVSDASRAWSPPALGTDDYASNGQNQYAQIESAPIVHDGSGNVTTDHRGRTYIYDPENRLKWVLDNGYTFYAYTAEGAVWYYSDDGQATLHFYDGGGQELAQYDGASYALQYRFVRLPGSVDDVFLMLDYVSSGCGSGCATYVHKDVRGSTVSTSDASGAETAAYQYSPYGESGPEGDAGFPFRFTGQRLDASTGLYNYKARFYDPETGRFLQTDPIGYADGMNMYAYVGGDPVNRTDPSGMVKHDGRVTYGGGGIPAVNYNAGGGGSSYQQYSDNLVAAIQGFVNRTMGGSYGGGAGSSSGGYGGSGGGGFSGDTVVSTGYGGGPGDFGSFLAGGYDGGGGYNDTGDFPDTVVATGDRPAWMQGLTGIDLTGGMTGQDANYAYISPEGPVIRATRKDWRMTNLQALNSYPARSSVLDDSPEAACFISVVAVVGATAALAAVLDVEHNQPRVRGTFAHRAGLISVAAFSYVAVVSAANDCFAAFG